MNHSYKDIGQRVKAYRLNRGFSQDELAEGICSRQTISFLENGQHLPSTEFMKKIAAKLGISLHEIMVDQVNNLGAKVQLDIIKVYIETADYVNAYPLIEECECRDDLLEYQRRELVLCRAECLIRTGKAEEAIKLLTDQQQRFEMEREADDHFMATLYDKLGTAYYFLPNMTNAHAHYLRAYQLTLRFAEIDLTAARIAYNLGMACRQLNRNSDAIEFLSKAEAFFKNASDIKRLSHTFFELGIAYAMKHEYEQADRCIQESLAIYRSLNAVSTARLARQVHALAVLSQTQPDVALKELQVCASEYEKVGDIVRCIFTNAHLANILINQKKISAAKGYLDNALSRLFDHDAESDPRLVYAYQVNAKYLLEVNDFEKCVEYSFKSSELFDRMGLERDAADSLSLSAKAYHGQGKIDQAYEISQRVNEKLCRLQDQFSKRLEVY
ncbi:tetratricopeptide repeat protein [Tumebacillus algifaecis]|uniref:tetratricopeptide repeat protein n=1 Tax=Tumebacillus algifaecis TaxID=1214604 RepID=UPI00155F9ECF|nr:tetratricopeptide repeat protein [Tumebacillus algifaecis]